MESEDAQFGALWAHFLQRPRAQAWLLGGGHLSAADAFAHATAAPEAVFSAGGAAAGTLVTLGADGPFALGALVAAPGLAPLLQRTAVGEPDSSRARVVAAFARHASGALGVRFGVLRAGALAWHFARDLRAEAAAPPPPPPAAAAPQPPPPPPPLAAPFPRAPYPLPGPPSDCTDELWRGPDALQPKLSSAIDAALALPADVRGGGGGAPGARAPSGPIPADAILGGGGGWVGSARGPARGAVAKKPRAAQTLECGQCGALIRGKRGNLNRHIAARHSRQRGFACAMPKCALAFQSKLNLVRHMTRVHEGRGHRCAQCPRGFRNAVALARHARAAHDPRRAFACRVCGVCFGRRSVLDSHVEREHAAAPPAPDGGKAFACAAPGCPSRFDSWPDVRAHEKLVHGGRVHHCPACPSVFDAEAALSRHLRTDHAVSKTSCNCPICGSVYSERSNLLRHISLAHKDHMLEGDGQLRSAVVV